MIRALCVAVSVLVLLAGCSGHVEKVPEEEETGELVLFNWEDYIGPDTLSGFEARTGIEVDMITFDEEDEMVASLKSDPSRYDLIVTSDDSIKELRLMRLITEIDTSRIPNLANVDPKYLDRSHDPGNRYSVPYMWGTTGILVNREHVKNGADSWSILWNPAYSGRMALLDNPEEVLTVGLKMAGHSLNSADPDELAEARKLLLEQKPLLSGYYDFLTIQEKMISGELWAAQLYSGEAMAAVDQNDSLEYIIPVEGAAVWIDSFCLSRDASNVRAAEMFLDYILEPEVSAAIANHLWYANCNRPAREFTDSEILESPELYPPPEVLKRCEFYTTKKDEEEAYTVRMVNLIWSELRREQ